MFYIAVPVTGPALVAIPISKAATVNYPDISQDEAGLKKLFTQFSFPRNFPAMCAATPGSIPRWGTGVLRSGHAFGAAFRHPKAGRRFA